MTLRDWLRRQRPNAPELVQQALSLARAGDPDAGVALVRGHVAEALDALNALPEPRDTSWLQLAARLLYRSGDMPAAASAAQRAVTQQGDDAATWHLLGRAQVWQRRPDADRAFARAAALDPDRFVRPHRVSRARFERLAAAAVDRIPAEFHASLANTLIVVDDLPALEAVRAGEDPDLLGIYEGATVLEPGMPERIVLYQRNHENVSGSEADLIEEVEETVRHEIGHHFGMEEDELPY